MRCLYVCDCCTGSWLTQSSMRDLTDELQTILQAAEEARL